MPIIQTKNLSLFYESDGNEEAFPLILITGAGHWRETWYRNVNVLKEHFRVITFDNRGIGNSDKPDVPYTLDTLADDTLALMDALNLPSASIMGHGLGAGVGVAILRKNPERVRKLILGASFYWGPDVILPAYRSQPKRRDLLETIRQEIRLAVAPSFEEDHPEVFRKMIEMRFKNQQPPHSFTYQCQATEIYYLANHMGDFVPTCPVLLMHGRHDNVVPYANCHQIMQAWPEAKMVGLEEAGHLFYIESPDITNAAIINFLSE